MGQGKKSSKIGFLSATAEALADPMEFKSASGTRGLFRLMKRGQVSVLCVLRSLASCRLPPGWVGRAQPPRVFPGR